MHRNNPMQQTLKNKTIFTRDNLEVLRGIDSNTIDLIYLDPPFNKKRVFTSPIGSTAQGASFIDIFREEDVKKEWLGLIAQDYPKIAEYINGISTIGHISNKNYLCYMAIRLIELHRILKDTGSLFLHCDYTMNSYLRLLLDSIFGENNFRNEIIWCYHGPGSPKMRQFNRKSDTILWYSKGSSWTFNTEDTRTPYKDSRQSLRKRMSPTGSFTKEEVEDYQTRGKVLENWWIIRVAARSKKEYTGYSTQKPLELLQRIILASTEKGDVVLDPFCGCATTCVAAETLGRQWVGIDVSAVAYQLVEDRLAKLSIGNSNDKKSAKPQSLGIYGKVIHRTDIPQRTDIDVSIKPKKEIKHWLYGKQEGHCLGMWHAFWIL